MKIGVNHLVYDIIRKIPYGRVSTYAAVARAIGYPRAARAVGNALNKNPYAPHVPCHRIVKSNGDVGGFARGQKAKENMLKQEGIKIKQGKIFNFCNIFYDFS